MALRRIEDFANSLFGVRLVQIQNRQWIGGAREVGEGSGRSKPQAAEQVFKSLRRQPSAPIAAKTCTQEQDMCHADNEATESREERIRLLRC